MTAISWSSLESQIYFLTINEIIYILHFKKYQYLLLDEGIILESAEFRSQFGLLLAMCPVTKLLNSETGM